MQTLGIAIDPGSGKPKLFGVVLSGSAQTPVVQLEFEFRAQHTTPAEQATALARLLQGKLPGLVFDAAGIRVAGAQPVASRRKAAFSRAHAEGAVLFVLREHLGRELTLGDPKSFAAELGERKDVLIERAAALSKGKADAAMAAIAAFGG
jgi:hypothetical protein